MAEAHSTSVATVVATAVPESQSNPAPNDTDSLKQELINVKRTLECLVQAVQNLSGTEVQAVSCLLSWFSALPPHRVLNLLVHTTPIYALTLYL